MSRVLPLLFALVVWLALWGEISVVNVGSGVLVVAVLAVVFRPSARAHTVHPVALVRLLAVFVGRLVTSSASVVRTVLAPTPDRLRSGVVGVELSQTSSLVATVVADAISLTPGTLTLEARTTAPGTGPPVLFVHVLGLDDPEAVRADVRQLERLVVSAITPVATAGGEPAIDDGEDGRS